MTLRRPGNDLQDVCLGVATPFSSIPPHRPGSVIASVVPTNVFSLFGSEGAACRVSVEILPFPLIRGWTFGSCSITGEEEDCAPSDSIFTGFLLFSGKAEGGGREKD